MSNIAIATADTFLGYMPQEVDEVRNTTQEIIVPLNETRDYMLASERALSAIWMTPEEDEVWKDL